MVVFAWAWLVRYKCPVGWRITYVLDGTTTTIATMFGKGRGRGDNYTRRRSKKRHDIRRTLCIAWEGFFSFIFLRDQTGDKMRQDGPSWVGKILSGLHLARCWAKRTTTTKKEKEEGEKKGDDEVDDGSTFPLFLGGVSGRGFLFWFHSGVIC